MTPELSRRLAWALQFIGSSTADRWAIVQLALEAGSFDKLPTEIQALIVAVETEHGTNPNLRGSN